MERKIGEIFEFCGKWYQCLKSDGSCADCAFFRSSCGSINDKGICRHDLRKDATNVIFKRLEKVGEPYMLEDKKFQKYRVFKTPYIYNKIDCSWQSFDDPYYVSFEIKQINEDMEEKYSELIDIVHEYMDKDMTYKYFKEAINNWVDDYIANKESNKPTLKPFDIQKAREGKPVCTRDGRKARIICFDKKNDYYPIIALVETEGKECIFQYTSNGEYLEGNENNSHSNLMMLPERKEGWVNVYNDTPIYDTKESAESGASTVKRRIDTVKISWEE